MRPHYHHASYAALFSLYSKLLKQHSCYIIWLCMCVAVLHRAVMPLVMSGPSHTMPREEALCRASQTHLRAPGSQSTVRRE